MPEQEPFYVCVCECIESWKTPVKVGWFPEGAHKQWEKKGGDGGGGAGEGWERIQILHLYMNYFRWQEIASGYTFGFLQMC